MTRKLLLPVAVAALVAAGFVAGQLAAPAPVASAQGGGVGGPPKPLPRPYDVMVTMKNPDATNPRMLEKVTCALATTFDVDKTGDHTFLRLSNQAGKLWYFPLENVQMVECVPIGGGATPAPAAPGTPAAPGK